MATLLDGVNEVLKKTGVLDSDAGLLTSLTDSPRQIFIDSAVQALNETVDQLYTYCHLSKPKQMKESTITLVDGERSYSLNSQLVVLRREYSLIDAVNNHFITILSESGYWGIITSDIEQDDTGLPDMCAINPINGRLIVNRTPTSVEAGRTYKYRYDRDTSLCEKDDCFPFTDAVFRAVVPAAAQLWRLNHQKEFDNGLFRASMARAAGFLRKLPPRTSWAPVSYTNSTDPFNAQEVR